MKDIIATVASRYSGQEAGEPELVDENENGLEEEIERKVPDSEAIQALAYYSNTYAQQESDYRLL